MVHVQRIRGSHLSRCSFETARLRVSRWPSEVGKESIDLPSVVAQLLTPNVTASLPEPWHGPYSRSRAARWIQDRDAEGTTLLVEDRSSAEPIGLVLLHDSSQVGDSSTELRLGYLVAEAYWGRGYATELLNGFIRWTRSSPYRRVVAGVASDNTASKRVLEKSGFHRLPEAGGPEESWVFEA